MALDAGPNAVHELTLYSRLPHAIVHTGVVKVLDDSCVLLRAEDAEGRPIRSRMQPNGTAQIRGSDRDCPVDVQQQQVEEIAPAPGTPFDPTRHQALMHRDAAYPVPTVVQLLQKGYALHGRTLRPAQVAVSKSA